LWPIRSLTADSKSRRNQRPDALLTRLEAEIDAQCEPKEPAMSAAEQSKRAAELAEQLLELERQEKTLIDAALAEGVDIMRRADADPRAVLGVSIAAKVKALAAA
jgi:hypothetical protein